MRRPAQVLRDQGGATLVEYTIFIGLIAAVLIVLLQALVSWIEDQWEEFDEEVCKIPEHAQGRGCDPPGQNKN